MPYFSWQGISLHGHIRRGRSFAQSEKELDSLLIKRDIALLRAKKTRDPLMQRAVRVTDTILFFRSLWGLITGRHSIARGSCYCQ